MKPAILGKRGVASVIGVGFLPRAPGTWASAAALIAGCALLPWPGALPVAAGLACAAGFWAIPGAVPDWEADPAWVVIDEVAGQWIAMLGLAGFTWYGVALAFAGFRVLDITKPGPVGWADRQGGAFGIMADDIIAGGITAAGLLALRFLGVEL